MIIWRRYLTQLIVHLFGAVYHWSVYQSNSLRLQTNDPDRACGCDDLSLKPYEDKTHEPNLSMVIYSKIDFAVNQSGFHPRRPSSTQDAAGSRAENIPLWKHRFPFDQRN